MNRLLLIFAAVALSYAAGSQLSFAWFETDTSAAFFPAAGVTLATLLLVERRAWWVVIAAAATAEFSLDLAHDITPASSAGYTLANMVQPLVAAFLITRFTPRVDLSRLTHLVGFLVFGVVVGPLVGAVIGASTFTLVDGNDGWARFVLEWWVGDGLGALVVGAVILSVLPWAWRGYRPRQAAEAGALFAGSIAATVAVFWFEVLPFAYVPVVLLMVAAFRLGTPAVAVIGATTAFLAAEATGRGHPYWDALDVSPVTGLLYLQLTLGTMVATALGISAEVSERERRAITAASAAQFEALANTAPAMLWVTDAANEPAFLSRGWFEYTGEDATGGLLAAWQRAVHPEDLERTSRSYLAAVSRHEPFAIDYRLRRADGAYRWVLDSGRPRAEHGATRAGYVGSTIDVHERQQNATALKESEARLRTLFSSIDEGFCMCEMIVDDQGRAIDYRFVEVNALFGAMTGLDDPVNRTAKELIPDLEPAWIERYAKVAFESSPTRFRLASAAMGRHFDVFATPVEPYGCFALVFTDVTEATRAAQALRNSEAAERHARGLAEFTTLVLTEVEAADGVHARARRLVELMVPRLADVAAFEIGADVIASAHHGGAQHDIAGMLASGSENATSQPQVVRTDEVVSEERVVGTDQEHSPHSYIAIPIEIGPGPAGTIHLWRSEPGRPTFGNDDREVATGLAKRVGLLLASARVLENEHETSLRLQQALLPDPAITLPMIATAARYVPADGTLRVGGDWYDAFVLPSGRIGLAVGDVVGHGLAAAAEMGALRVALHALADYTDGPGQLLERVDTFAKGPSGTSFATAFFGSLDLATGHLRYALAGHPAPLLVTPAGQTIWLEGGRSVPLCSVDNPHRPEADVVLEPGSVLIMFTDGLVERRRKSIDEGFARLEQIAVREKDSPVNRICNCLISEMTGEANLADDVVVLCVRYAPVSSTFSRQFPARPSELALLRAAVREWMSDQQIDDSQRFNLLLTLGEACSNAIEHAYRDSGSGVVDVEISAVASGDLVVRVDDQGSWWSHAPDPRRGRGTPIMRTLARDFERRSDNEGTTVRMTIGRGA
jgi:PAS domain S-box-containing protein